MLFGILIAVNLQTSFLTPPMAMSAYYLKGVAPPQVQLWTIFKGCFPFLGMVLVTLALIYAQPKLVNWLPDLMYNNAAQDAQPTPTGPVDRETMDPAFLMGGSSDEKKEEPTAASDMPPADKTPEANGTMDPSFLSGGSASGEKKTE